VKEIKVILVCMFLAITPLVLANEVGAEKKILIDKVLEQTGQSARAIGRQFSDLFVQQMTLVLKKTTRI